MNHHHIRQPRLPFPKEIGFDKYRASLAAGSNHWTEEQIRLTYVEMGVRATASHMALARSTMLDLMDRAKVFVLTPEAMEVVIQTAERLRQKTVPGVIDVPTLPMWIEFDGKYLVDQDRRISALWMVPEVPPNHRPDGSFSIIRFYAEDEAVLEDRFVYDASSASWKTTHPGGCQYQTNCSLSKSHQKPGVGLVLSQRADAFESLSVGCLCYENGQRWAHFVWVLMQMLRAEGAKHTVIDRRLQVRYKKEHRSTKEKEEERERDAWNATHPVYIRISLEYRLHARYDQTPSGRAITYDMDEKHLTNVIGHWRLLIPAPDKPWRGTQPRVVWVRGHEKYVHGKRKVRYHVTP